MQTSLFLTVVAFAGCNLTAAQQLENRASRKHLRSLEDTEETSPHGGAYSGGTVHEILADVQWGKIHTNWVPTVGEILQFCGMDGDQKCQQVKLSDVKRQHAGIVHHGYDSGEEIFFVKFWPPLTHHLPKDSPVNKAGTGATPKNPGWSESDCTVTDLTTLKKWKHKAGQTLECQNLVVEAEKKFELLHLPKFAGHPELALCLASFTGLVLLASLAVAINRWARGSGRGAWTYAEESTREILREDANME